MFFSISFFISSYHHGFSLEFSGFTILYYLQGIGVASLIISAIICDTIWLTEELNANERKNNCNYQFGFSVCAVIDCAGCRVSGQIQT
jgi:hypothetical protein